mgnify:CR=1 FL=1
MSRDDFPPVVQGVLPPKPTFEQALEDELFRRYMLCEDPAATPSNILLAVTNAVAAARKASK